MAAVATPALAQRRPNAAAERSAMLARNRARTAEVLGFYGTGRIDRPTQSYLSRGSVAEIYEQIRGSPAEYLRRSTGLGFERDPSSVLRSSTFPGLEPVGPFRSRYLDMVSPADALTFPTSPLPARRMSRLRSRMPAPPACRPTRRSAR
jgi:hypothetical protein